jgi:D-alanyl-D-alanine carboxypeptidase (penicillin-binding protein 5/6)
MIIKNTVALMWLSLTSKLLLVISLCMTSVFTLGLDKSVQAANQNTNALQLDVKAAILIEAQTGQVLYQFNADQAYPPASMSKMMTEYLVMEAIANKKITWEDMVPVSKYASDVIGSGQLLAVGEQMSVRDMVKQMAIYSANDASIALAEFLSGSESNFAKLMNETAAKLGLKQSQFMNSTGLARADLGKYAPTDISGETLMSARDVAMLAKHLVSKHSEILSFSKITSEKLKPTDENPMVNLNWMLEGNASNINFKQYVYQGLDGLKTGHTDEAGYCFTGTAQRNGLRLISVVMGATTKPSRFIETRKILDYGFNQFEMKEIVPKNYSYKEYSAVRVTDAVELEQSVVTKDSFKLMVKKGTTLEGIKPTFTAIDESKRYAPLKKGAKLAEATYTFDGQKYKVDLVAASEAEEASWFRLMLRAIKDFFVGLF